MNFPPGSEESGEALLKMALRTARRAVRRGMLPEREVEEARGAALVRLVEKAGRFDRARGLIDAYLWKVASSAVADYARWFRNWTRLGSSNGLECGQENEEQRSCCSVCPFQDPGFEREREARATLNRVDELLEATPPRIAAACHQLLAECRGASDVPPMSRSKKSRIRGACAILFLTRRMDSSPSETIANSRTYFP